MEKVRDTWRYQVTWYTNDHKKILVDGIDQRILELLPRQCRELQVTMGKAEVASDAVTFQMSSDQQLNSTKTLRTLQKKLTKQLSREFPQLVERESEFWDPKTLMVTTTDEWAKEDVRVEKVLKALWEVGYYDLYEAFENNLGPFKNYLRSRSLGIVDWGDRMFLVDPEALSHEINLNCFECTKIYKYGCCCGSPCDYGVRNLKVFDQYGAAIGAELKSLDEVQYKDVVAKGGLVASDGTINECNGRCALLAEHEGVWKCLAHKYGLDHGIPIYKVCPLSCLMYPLEILELITDKQKKVILLTSVLEDEFAKEYGRWGSYESLEVDLRCLDKKASNEVFKEKDYKPVYEVNKGLLIHEFGEAVYQGIDAVIKNTK